MLKTIEICPSESVLRLISINPVNDISDQNIIKNRLIEKLVLRCAESGKDQPIEPPCEVCFKDVKKPPTTDCTNGAVAEDKAVHIEPLYTKIYCQECTVASHLACHGQSVDQFKKLSFEVEAVQENGDPVLIKATLLIHTCESCQHQAQNDLKSKPKCIACN